MQYAGGSFLSRTEDAGDAETPTSLHGAKGAVQSPSDSAYRYMAVYARCHLSRTEDAGDAEHTEDAETTVINI
jgi:hypothetical protein